MAFKIGYNSKTGESTPSSGTGGSVKGDSSSSNSGGAGAYFDTGVSGKVGYASGSVTKIVSGKKEDDGNVIYSKGSKGKTGGVPLSSKVVSQPTQKEPPGVPIGKGLAEKISGKTLPDNAVYTVLPSPRPTTTKYNENNTKDFTPQGSIGVGSTPTWKKDFFGRLGYEVDKMEYSKSRTSEGFKSAGLGTIAFGGGVALGVKSFADIFIHPVRTIKETGYAVSHPFSAGAGIKQQLVTRPSGFAGEVTGSVLTGFGVSKVFTLFKKPNINVANVKADTKITSYSGGYSTEVTNINARMISKPRIGKTQAFTIEGISTSRTSMIKNNVYARYGKFGTQIFKGDKVISNVKGSIGGIGKIDEVGGFVERSGVVIQQQGKGVRAMEVGTIGTRVKGVGTKILSSTLSYGKNIKYPGKPSSVSLGMSKEIMSVGESTFYSYKGSTLSGSKMIRSINKGFKGFKSDFISKPGKIPKISGSGGDAGLLIETGKAGLSNSLITKQTTSFKNIGLVGGGTVGVVKSVNKLPGFGSVPVSLTKTNVKTRFSPVVNVAVIQGTSSKGFVVPRTKVVRGLGIASMVKPSFAQSLYPRSVVSPKIRTTPIVDVGVIQETTPRTIIKPITGFVGGVVPPSVFFLPPTPPVIPPFIPGGGSDYFNRGGYSFLRSSRLTRYVPSYSALFFGLKGSYKPGKLSKSGLDYRPITPGYKLTGGDFTKSHIKIRI